MEVSSTMLNSILATNYLGETIEMSLRIPQASGVAVTNVTGIDPGAAVINMSEISTNDGAMYSSSRIGKRTITLDLQFWYEYDVETIRHIVYKYFPLKQPITLYFVADERVCMIDGYVESNSVNIFSAREGCKITVVCPYPYFYSAGEGGVHTTVFYGIDPGFEFPFSNESLHTPLLEFGQIKTSTDEVIDYYGDAEVGMLIHITAIDTTGEIIVYNITMAQYMTISSTKIAQITGAGIGAGDEIIIDTTRGHKRIHLLREGHYINILNALDRGTTWLYLVKGENVIAYECDGGASKLHFQVENRVLYEGV